MVRHSIGWLGSRPSWILPYCSRDVSHSKNARAIGHLEVVGLETPREETDAPAREFLRDLRLDLCLAEL
jgi:hypothetical protein